MRYRCPVCLYDRLPYPAADYHICPCCGTEFGNDDAEFSHSQLREMWIAGGASWFFGNPPAGWNPWMQLIAGGLALSVPQVFRVEIRGAMTGTFERVYRATNLSPSVTRLTASAA